MTAPHSWNLFRAGGFDQVQLDSGADLLALKDLYQKLWVALICPVRGIEFDTKMLDMIDNDGDAHGCANKGSLSKNADSLVQGAERLALHDIDDSSEAGKHVLASARHILKTFGKADALEISLDGFFGHN